MLISAGYHITFNCPAPTSMLLQLSVHPSRETDLRSPDVVGTDPHLPSSSYLDQFGNRVTRVAAPAGRITFSNRFIIRDSGQPDETPEPAVQWQVPRLPDETLMFLVSSRYCDSDNLSDMAWAMFGSIETGVGRVQAICDYAHNHIRFDYQQARPTRTASDAVREGVGVCRDFAHLAIALCRAMNIPARYCTGYLGDIGVPPDPAPMDFSAWFEAFLEGRWYTFDARHNHPRIGRVLMARGRDAADAAISTAFGQALLERFDVMTEEVAEAG